MVNFRSALILAVGAAMQLAPMSQPVSAAELPSVKDTPYEFVPLWTGLYFGVHGGGALGKTGIHDTFDYVGDPTVDATVNKVAPIGGAHGGYNFQYGHFVFGLEGGVGYLNISASKSASNLKPKSNSCSHTYAPGDTVKYDDSRGSKDGSQLCSVDAKYSGSSDLYGDLTARFGYLMGRTLFYAKGGAAVLDASFKANYLGQNCTTMSKWSSWYCTPLQGQAGPSPFNSGDNGALVGWTAGAGVEYKLTPSWSFKAEYQHFDFGSMSYSYNPAPYVIPCKWCDHTNGHYTSAINGKTDVSFGSDAVTLGINYHLSDDAELK